MLRRGLVAGLVGGTMLVAAAPAANATMAWNPPSADFGNENIGSTSAPRTFVLTAVCEAGNPCTAPPNGIHNFGAPAVTGPNFAIVPATNSCVSGVLITPFNGTQAQCASQVTFTPTSTGIKTATLATPTGPDVALSGTGVATPQAPGANPGPTLKKCKKGKKRSIAAAKKCKRKGKK